MRTNLVILLLVFAGSGVRGQKRSLHPMDATGLAFSLGIKAGVSYSNPKMAQDPSNDYYVPERSYHSGRGIHIGLVYHRPLNKYWALHPELVFAIQAYEFRQEVPQGVYVEEDKPGYFNLPLLVQYVPRPGVVVYSGPQPGFLWSGKPYTYKRGDLAWVIGLGLISRVGLGVDARYNAGLLNVAKRDPYWALVEAKNRVAQVSIVYFFTKAPKRPRVGDLSE